MGNEMQNILNNYSLEDMEKFKILLSIMPQVEQKEVVTLRVFVQEYNDFIKQNRSAAYYKSVGNSFKHLTDFFGPQKSIQSIGLKEVENFLSHLQRKVAKGNRVYYRTLKAAFNKAIDWGYISENYFKKVKLPKKQRVNPAYITSEQLSVISKQLGEGNEVVKSIVIAAFYTGMRLNEVVNLTWKNVDLSARIITVGDENFTTKGRNQRYIPICDEALTSILSSRQKRDKLQEMKNPTPRILRIQNPLCVSPLKKGGENAAYVFSKPNGMRFTGDYVSKKFKDACKAVGIDKAIHFHSLRHSFASNLAQKGVSLYTIKELLGHSSIATTEIYSHLNMESLREAIGKLNSPHPDLLPKGEGGYKNELKLITEQNYRS